MCFNSFETTERRNMKLATADQHSGVECLKKVANFMMISRLQSIFLIIFIIREKDFGLKGKPLPDLSN